MMQKILKTMLAILCTVGLLSLTKSSAAASAFQFDSSTGPDSFTCLASELGCEQVNHVYFRNASGDFLWQTTAWTSSPNHMLEYYSWTKGFTWEQDTDPHDGIPIEPHLGVIIPVRMKNNGIPGVYQGTLYVDAKNCNRNVTPWDCYFAGGTSYTMTMTVVADPTATPTPTRVPTATPTPPSPTATPTPTPPLATPTPTNSPTPTVTADVSVTPTSTQNSLTTITSADSSGTQARPKTCTAGTPDSPRLLSIEPLTQTAVKLTWSKVTDATHYAISYGTKSGTYVYGVSNTGNTTSSVVKSLATNTRYHFVVQAINNCAPSGVSNELTTSVDTSLTNEPVETVLAASDEMTNQDPFDTNTTVVQRTIAQEEQTAKTFQLVLIGVGFALLLGGAAAYRWSTLKQFITRIIG